MNSKNLPAWIYVHKYHYVDVKWDHNSTSCQGCMCDIWHVKYDTCVLSQNMSVIIMQLVYNLTTVNFKENFLHMSSTLCLVRPRILGGMACPLITNLLTLDWTFKTWVSGCFLGVYEASKVGSTYVGMWLFDASTLIPIIPYENLYSNCTKMHRDVWDLIMWGKQNKGIYEGCLVEWPVNWYVWNLGHTYIIQILWE